MPTENRSSNTVQMVSVPLDLVELALAHLPSDSAAGFELRALLAQPAARADGLDCKECEGAQRLCWSCKPTAQHQGEPAGYRWEQLGGKGWCYGETLPAIIIGAWQELYTHPPTSDGASPEQMTAQGADGYRNGIKAAAELAADYPELAQAIRALPLPQ